jgi:hypothetical protein
MKETLTLLLIVLTFNFVDAQFIKEKSINAQIGLGMSNPQRSTDVVDDDGLFVQGELVLKAASWIDLRPYLGFIWTNSDGTDINDKPTDEKGVSKALLLGGKTRVSVPIPWIAPYIEIGIGTSMGRFVTQTAFDNIEKNGIIYHIPFSIGFELGKNHSVDLGLIFYLQPSVEQEAGAFAIGVTIPLKSKE